MVDMYIFETSQLLEQLEQAIISSEQANEYSESSINEIFRFMHTIKGSSGMMLFNNIAALAHSMEDLFYFLRENTPDTVDYSELSDLILEGLDFTKIELQKIKNRDEVDGDASNLIKNIQAFLSKLKSSNSSDSYPDKLSSKEIDESDNDSPPIVTDNSSNDLNSFTATIFFEDGCEMENIRAYTVINELTELTDTLSYKPENVLDDDESTSIIRKDGFQIFLKTQKNYEEINAFFMQTMFLKDLELIEIKKESTLNKSNEKNIPDKKSSSKNIAPITPQNTVQSIISVHVDKLDKLMDLVGEMVIAEAMVTQNPEITALELESFQKSSRRLHKISSEIQDMVMSIRMVPLSTTFMKMHRITRDMCKKLNKDITLEVIGEETEVDKNIIEHISDPLMHIIRNSIDHGIEESFEREAMNKNPKGTLVLEAKNSGSDVLVIIKDDGRGLNKQKILKKAKDNNLLVKKASEMTDSEIYNLVLLPGFSTKEQVTEFSGRGVGMDVVCKNLESVGGSVSVDSIEGKGTTITLKIPLTLAIIDGMNIAVGNSRYTIPITKIKESFRPKKEDLIIDPEGNEMIMLRGECLPILRLHKYYNIDTTITDFNEGILIMIEQEDRNFCIFADELIGKQQVVVKSLPIYIKKNKKITGLAGCTLLGDGSISLIIDTAGLTL
jgi:two-component system chemotaxis sensor kinase CheA